MKISNLSPPYMANDEALTRPREGGMTHLLWDETTASVLDSDASPAFLPVLENT
ncbi:hypothetical protein [Bradyrhizobium sp. ARR65]|uniref:hypothetical protein n=1 Tax=Bradyrhizobium sp. ARR65 TaxID=1040989 RepID=UPI000AF12E70|nr:hypothetical protein [Bradyrhizobium sp. ARR65]